MDDVMIIAILGFVSLFGLICASVYFFYLRDTPKNNLRRAKKYHMIAEKNYASGKFEDAKEYFALSKHYREKGESSLDAKNKR
ncbi:MAG: hypothetical protein V1859_07820 [archaeon]